MTEVFEDDDVNDGEPVNLVGIEAHVMASSFHGGALPEGSNYNWGEWVKLDSSPITKPKLSREELHELDLDQRWEVEVGVINPNKGRIPKFSHEIRRRSNGFPVIIGDIGVSPINVKAIGHYERTQGRVVTFQFDKTHEDDRQWYGAATPIIGNMRGPEVFWTVS